MSDCKCKFGDLHEGICACDTHHALQKGDCALCTKLHLQCETPGSLASTAVPDMDYTRLEPSADEAHKCLPPAASDRCPGSHQRGPGYNGTLCSSCADGFWATRGKCEQLGVEVFSFQYVCFRMLQGTFDFGIDGKLLNLVRFLF